MSNFDPNDKNDKKLKRWLIIGLCVYLVIVVAAFLFVEIIHHEKFIAFAERVKTVVAVLNPIFTGIVIAYLLNPVENFFLKTVFKKVKSPKTHKALSIICTYTLIIGLISIFLLVTTPQILKNFTEMPAQLHNFAIEAQTWLEKNLVDFENSDFYQTLISTFGLESIDIKKAIADFANHLINLENLVSEITNYILSAANNLYVIAKDFLLGLILSVYFLVAKERIAAQARRLSCAVLGKKKTIESIGLLNFIDRTFGGFIQGKIFNAIIIGFLTLLAFMIFGVPYPQLLAIIVGVTDLIPVFGPFIGAIPCAFIVFIAAPNKLIIMLLLIIVIQQIDGNYIGPKILGESTGLSALGVFLAIIIMGGYFGIPGMLLGVPIFAVTSALIKNAVDKKLEKRGLPSDISEYYGRYSLEEGSARERKRNMFAKVIDFFILSTKKIVLQFIRFIKKAPKIQRREASDADVNPSDSNEANTDNTSDSQGEDNSEQ